MIKKGILLVNLGTPDDCSTKSVRRYLKEFLSDGRVIELQSIVRWFLVNCLILPTRPKKSAHAYSKIWEKDGSPLMINSQNLTHDIQVELGSTYQVELAMRYGSYSINDALSKLKNCNEITILPMFPQYASATTGSIIEHIFTVSKDLKVFPSFKIIRDFYQEPFFIKSQAQLIQNELQDDDYLLLSYHGLPENHLKSSGCAKGSKACCVNMSNCQSGCYLSQCLKTSQLIKNKLNIDESRYTSSFQSRLGKTPWIKPYTDEVLDKLRQKGIDNLVVACPSFVSDCLETLEEIGIQAREQWLELGGKRFTLIPCLNNNPLWVKGLAELIK